MKLSSVKFCLVVSLLCHVVGFALFALLSPVAEPSSTTPSVSAPLVVFSSEPVLEKIPAPAHLKPATPPLDKKFGQLSTAETFMPLHPAARRPNLQTFPLEKHLAELARGQTVAARAAPLAGVTSNSVIVGARMSRVFAMANIQPDYYKNPKPEYPELARREHQQGIVWLRVHLTARGRPDRVAVAQSSGFEALDTAAVDAVRGWEFTPAQLGEAFVESEIDFPIQFRLE